MFILNRCLSTTCPFEGATTLLTFEDVGYPGPGTPAKFQLTVIGGSPIVGVGMIRTRALFVDAQRESLTAQ